MPSRGISQGDHLSPCLLLLCAEGLSKLLIEAEAWRLIRGVAVYRGSPQVSHLFFDDDIITLLRVNVSDCAFLMNLLHCYEKLSGQQVNMTISSLYLSPNIPT